MTGFALALGDWLGTYAVHSTAILVLALGATALLPRRYALYGGTACGFRTIDLANSRRLTSICS